MKKKKYCISCRATEMPAKIHRMGKLFAAVMAAGLLAVVSCTQPAFAAPAEFSDDASLPGDTVSENNSEVFSDAESSDPSSVFSSGTSGEFDDVFVDGVDKEQEDSSDLQINGEFSADDSMNALLNADAVSEKGSIHMYCDGYSLGDFSTLDEACKQITDPQGSYTIELSKGIYDLNMDFPEAYQISIKYDSYSPETEMLDCMIRVRPSSCTLNSSLFLENVSLGFISSAGNFYIGEHTLRLSRKSLIAANTESNTFSIIGGSDSKIDIYASDGGGIYGAELSIGSLHTAGATCIIASDNASHFIRTLHLNGSGNLLFTNNGQSGSSQNSIRIGNLLLESFYSVYFDERFDCTFENFDITADYGLTIFELAETVLPQWGRITFSGKLPNTEQLAFVYMIDSEQDCSNPEKAFFSQDQILITCPGSPGRPDLTAQYFWVRNEQAAFSQSCLLIDNGTGNYQPDTAYHFYYDQIPLSLQAVPQLGQKTGTASVTLDPSLSGLLAITEARWSSPDKLTTFNQGKTYDLIVKLNNLEGIRGKFTGNEKAALKFGSKTLNGTVQLSDENTLTIQFSYTIDRLASLPMTTLKSARCSSGTSVLVSWAGVSRATSYKVYRKTAGTSWKALKVINSSSTLSYKDNTVKPGTTYYYTVRAFHRNPDGTITWGGYHSRGLSVKPYIYAPKLISARITTRGAQVRWYRAAGSTAYRIYRRTASSGWKYLGTVKGTQNIFYDNTITKNGTYYYTVKGTYGKINGKYNRTGLKLTVPKLTAPGLVSAIWTQRYPGSLQYGVRLQWKPVKGAQYYSIMRRKAGTSKWTTIKKQSASEDTSYYDSSANMNTSYYYTVRPVISKYYGPYSSRGIYREKYFNIRIDL